VKVTKFKYIYFARNFSTISYKKPSSWLCCSGSKGCNVERVTRNMCPVRELIQTGDIGDISEYRTLIPFLIAFAEYYNP
jgi:hypothetical protein